MPTAILKFGLLLWLVCPLLLITKADGQVVPPQQIVPPQQVEQPGDATTPQTFPGKPYGPNNWVLDEALAIPAYAKSQLQILGNEINQFENAELVILTVDSTGNEDPRAFALNWFNRHRVGTANENNGVLVLCAMKQRAIEVILGDGLKSPANDAASKRVIDEYVIPRMKRNDVAGAMYGAGFGLARDVIGYARIGENIPRSQPELETADERRLRRARDPSWIQLYWLAVGGGLCGLFGIALFVARWRVRFGGRDCDKCHQPMVLLDEQQDDTFLDPPEILEEELGSVDYDAWACFQCKEVLKYRYGALLTRYSRCPRCHYKTRSKISRTIRAATQSRGGLVRVDEQCENCSYSNTYTYSTPRLPKPSKSRSGGGGWSGGGGGWSGGSSGGFSSGGGASGRW